VDISTDTSARGYTDVLKYSNPGPLLAGEVGEYAGVRFQSTSIAQTFASAGQGVDVIRSIFCGPGALGMGDLASLAVYYAPPGGKGDLLHQTAEFGCKMWVGAVLQEAAGSRYLTVEHSGAVLASGQA
jgi:N4-gp56 family major capsid protein